MTCVRVETVPAGEWTAPRCTAHQSATGAIIVDSVDTGEAMRVFVPGTYILAEVRDDRGQLLDIFYATRGGRS